LWAKGLNAKGNYKEMFPVCGGKCMSRKAVHNCVVKRFADDEEVETEVRKWLRRQTTGFDALVKRWYKCINIDGGFVEKYMFYVSYPFDTYLLTLPLI
jgi:hypothetical protein